MVPFYGGQNCVTIDQRGDLVKRPLTSGYFCIIIIVRPEVREWEMSSDDVRLQQQQAAFIGAYGALLEALETAGFADTMRREAWGKDWYIHREASTTATMEFSFIGRKGTASIGLVMKRPGLPTLSLSRVAVTFGELELPHALGDEEFAELFEAFLSECRKLFQRYNIEPSSEVRSLFGIS